MDRTGTRGHFLRARTGHERGRVTFVELFFDLVFVFAVTQLSHHLLEHFTPLGALQTLMLFLAVWWVWIDTSWVTNWLDPGRAPVRLLLFALMLAGLVLSTSIPDAFGAKALVFAGAYALMQVGRSAFMLWALGEASPRNTRNFQRIMAWQALAGLFWIAGALAGDGAARLALWGVALGLECLAPAVGFRVPGLGRSTTEDWDVEGGHLAERCGLFIIIALGESILVTGATFGRLEWTPATVAAFAVAFAGSVAMWWIYFDTGAETGSRTIAAADDPGRLARVAYTYVHLLIVGGIILAAVADELVLAHPAGHADARAAMAALGGPALYVFGNLLFKCAVFGRPPLSHMLGLGLFALLVPASPALSPLALGAAAAGVLVFVAVWERVLLRQRRAAASGV